MGTLSISQKYDLQYLEVLYRSTLKTLRGHLRHKLEVGGVDYYSIVHSMFGTPNIILMCTIIHNLQLSTIYTI